MAAGDANRSRAEGAAALYVRRRVSDHNHAFAADIEAEYFARAFLCYRRKLGTMLVVRPEGVDSKAIRIDSSGSELHSRSGLDVSGEQPQHNLLAGLERVEQLHDSRERAHVE